MDDITLTESGSGRPALILHGGGGPFTVANLAAHLTRMRTLVPTHPGWNGTTRTGIERVGDLAPLYLDYLEREELRDVLVIGSSLGGWAAAELAILDGGDRVSGLILIDAGGIEVEAEPIRDFFSLDARGVAEYSFADPEKFFRDPATLPPEQLAAQKANLETMRTIAGEPYMHDPSLLGRLGGIAVPTMVIWGDSDRIFTPGYGRAYAAAIPGARFELIHQAGHLPHLEKPEETFAAIDSFVTA